MKKTALALIALILAASASAEGVRRVWVEGHRGSRGTHPENTLPAFDEALRAGVEVLELDMGVTKDNIVVVSHDPQVNPLICLGPGGARLEKPVPLRSLTLKELKEYDCGSLKNPRFPEQAQVPGTRTPTLDEVFAYVKNSTQPAAARVRFNIETKIFPGEPLASPPPDEFARLVATVLRKHGMEKRTVVQSFDYRPLLEIKKISPSVKTAQLTAENLLDPDSVMRGSGADIWSPYFKWINGDVVKKAQKSGITVVPWTLNSEEEWDRAVSYGVDGIITDYPAKLIDHLKKRKLR
ncbi:MAG: glycerophosphoryl diester phosphodiesterase [Elusimicrobia bacterium]|nr:MAG: glycerophosphoryl diester phosphodiesterase [Elusimicrobiota bacterium]KAF0156025.1 MAG: glycerophosphoryl diester phosphodiesterase [Elusimicrobiota bacterium]